MNGFDVVPLGRPSFVDRLLRRKTRCNGIREIQNLLARSRIAELPDAAIEQILSDYGLRSSEVRPLLKETYATVMRDCARDQQLSDDEVADLKRLRDLMGLTDADVREVERAVLDPIYRTALQEAVSDRNLTVEEKDKLQLLASKLRLPDEVVAAIRQQDLGDLMQRVFDEAIADRRLSPEEEKQLAALAEQLGVQLRHDEQDAVRLERYRLMWRISQGELPELAVPIRLQRGERCHAAVPASRYEIRTATKRVRYAGPTARIRIMKGVYYRLGSLGVQRVTEDVLTLLDTGTLYVTSKRLIFDGSGKTTSIPFRKILNVTPFPDGIGVEKETGKDQLFKCTADLEILCAVLDAALRLEEA